METFRMYSCQQKNWRNAQVDRPQLAGLYRAFIRRHMQLPPESSTRTMQPPSSAGRCRTMPPSRQKFYESEEYETL